MDKNFERHEGYNYLPVKIENKKGYKNKSRSKEINKTGAVCIAVLLLLPFLLGVMSFFEPKVPASELITSGEYAALLINSVDSMDLPYEIKINLLSINDADEFLNIINNSLDRRSQIKKDKPVTREQSAYMTDALLKYISVNSAQAEDTLTHLPAYISKNMLENQIRKAVTNRRDRDVFEAYYILKDLSEPELTEHMAVQLLSSLPVTQRTAAYILDRGATKKEQQDLINMLNYHSAVTDSDIIKMNMEYRIIQSYAPVISFEPLYLEVLPNEEIAYAYIKSTLADSSLPQSDYDYIISKYTGKYAVTLHYRELKAEITSDEIIEIQEILNKYPEIIIEIADKHEKFDAEYNIPVIITHSNFRELLASVSPDDGSILSEYYIKFQISPHDDDYEFIIPSDEQIEIYILRDDLTVAERLRLDTFGFTVSGKNSAVFMKINNDFIYSDIRKVSSWARESVEMLYKTNIMKGARMFNFDPKDKLTIDEAYEIMGNLVSGMIIY